MTSSPKIPFQWERLTDEGKVAFIDSAKVAIEKARASGSRDGNPQIMTRPAVEGAAAGARRDGSGGDAPRSGTASTPAPAPAATAPPGTMTVTSGGNTTVTAVGPGGGAFGGQLPPLVMVLPSELPDYKPAFAPGSTRADADGNLWIRTSQNVNAIPVSQRHQSQGRADRQGAAPAEPCAGWLWHGWGRFDLAVRDGASARLEKARAR